VVTVLGVVSDLGLDLGIIRFGAIHAGEGGGAGIQRTTRKALRAVLASSLVILVLVQATAHILADGVFGKPQLTPLFRAFGFIIPLMAAQSLLLATTRAMKVMKYSFYVWIFQPLAGLAFAIPLLMLRRGIQAVAFSQVASVAVGTAIGLYGYLRTVPRLPETGESLPLGKMLRFSAPLSVTKWMHYANERTEVFFLGFLPSALDVGIYNISWRLAGMETVFRLSLEYILAPFSSDLSHRREIPQLEALYKTTAKWGFTAALMLFSIYALFAAPIMKVFDPSYVSGAGVLVALALAQLFNEFTGPCGTILIMSGRAGLSLLNTIVLLVSSIGLDWWLIPRHGLSGAAVAGALTIILVSAGGIVLLRRFVYSGPLYADAAYALLFIAAYIALLALLKLDAEDRVVIDAIRRKFGRSSPKPTEGL
jgi:O-antigen/teichoic acid export membrane protein